VGVFVETPVRQACTIAYQLGLRAIQTHDSNLSTEDAFPFAQIPAFRVKDLVTLEAIRESVSRAQALGRPPAAILVDAFVEGQMGGTGCRAPWDLLAGFDPGVPLILAGGLTPENVAEAIEVVRPWGVDVASGLESVPGRKDAEKVRRFVKIARDASSRDESR
jgi:phosphoribosylanthranilate isomerase